jgi:AcrR family transcriptional regulator
VDVQAEPTKEEAVDGRRRRAARSRQLIVDTFLDLLGEGEVKPTVQMVSERSGVSMSTVWRLFEDVEALYSVVVATQIGRVSPLIVEVGCEGSLDSRVKRLVDSRARLYEAITPVRRFGVRLADSSATIRRDLRVANDFFRAAVAEVFQHELEGRGPEALEVVDAVTSWDAWERLRSVQGLSVRRAKAAVAMSLLALLGTS